MRMGNTTKLHIWPLLLATLLFGGCLSSTPPPVPDDGSSGPPISSNQAPTISGSPDAAILIGGSYSFTPAANDADGDSLSFSIENRPRWATFETGRGRLSGPVLPGDQGVYDDIQITVTDGTSSSSLQTFSIIVSDGALGSMTLSWAAPSKNTDGTALTNLAGYFIYYGLRQGDYPYRIRIDNPSISTYLVENLLPDTYYVVATSINSMGVESSYSGVAVKIVTAN
jgi:hypothetical protein